MTGTLIAVNMTISVFAIACLLAVGWAMARSHDLLKDDKSLWVASIIIIASVAGWIGFLLYLIYKLAQ